jgi:hypothetical protein
MLDPFQKEFHYHVLSIPTNAPLSLKSIYKVKAPSRVVFFVWMVALGKKVTLYSLAGEEKCYSCRLVLYVEEECIEEIMEFAFPSLWYRLSYAKKG